jgi:hypothetical protein
MPDIQDFLDSVADGCDKAIGKSNKTLDSNCENAEPTS